MKNGEIVRTPFFSYHVEKQLGQGGSGTVYQVKRCEDNNLFALKVLTEQNSSSEKAKRFKNEYCFLSSHSHPNIIKPIDSGCTKENCLFYIMPLANNTLRDLISENKLHGATRLKIAKELLCGLHFLHCHGLIHRDIKPENILLLGETPVIADIGIAHFEEEYLYTDIQTRKGTRLANFQYAAPEQRLKDMPPTQAMDVYSIALVIHELFTAEFLQGSGRTKIATIFPEYGYWDSTIEQALINDPNKRIPTVENFVELLKRNKWNIKFLIRDSRSEATHFHLDRFSVAFPEIDPLQSKCFTTKNIILKRLEQLLRPPYNLGGRPCIWWTHGVYDNEVSSFRIDWEKQIAYIDHFECDIKKIIAFNSCLDYKSFVYVEVAKMPSLFRSPDEIREMTKNSPYTQITESINYYDSHLISAIEAENGGFYNEEDNYIEIDREKHVSYERFLAPWNFLLLSRQNSFIQTGDKAKLAKILDGILIGNMEVEKLKEYVETLSKPDFYRGG